jgi:hypothetical protein
MRARRASVRCACGSSLTAKTGHPQRRLLGACGMTRYAAKMWLDQRTIGAGARAT